MNLAIAFALPAFPVSTLLGVLIEAFGLRLFALSAKPL